MLDIYLVNAMKNEKKNKKRINNNNNNSSSSGVCRIFIPLKLFDCPLSGQQRQTFVFICAALSFTSGISNKSERKRRVDQDFDIERYRYNSRGIMERVGWILAMRCEKNHANHVKLDWVLPPYFECFQDEKCVSVKYIISKWFCYVCLCGAKNFLIW